MSTRLRTVLAALGAVVLLSAPAVGLTAPPKTTYNTTLAATDPSTKIAYYFGSLQLTVGKDGIVHGWYIPQYESTYTPVTGSYKEGKYWLTIGNGEFQIYATRQRDGSLAGTATNTAITQSQPAFPTTPARPSTSQSLYPQTFQFYARPTDV